MQLLAPPRDPHLARKEQQSGKSEGKGEGKGKDKGKGKGNDKGGPDGEQKWYQLPATQITEDVKRELRLLHLRGAYDPKRFYKVRGGGTCCPWPGWLGDKPLRVGARLPTSEAASCTKGVTVGPHA